MVIGIDKDQQDNDTGKNNLVKKIPLIHKTKMSEQCYKPYSKNGDFLHWVK